MGIGGHAVAISQVTGMELWRTKLKSSSFVTIRQSGRLVFAGAGGELFCLDASSGQILWNNNLTRLGLLSFNSNDETALFATLEAQRQNQPSCELATKTCLRSA